MVPRRPYHAGQDENTAVRQFTGWPPHRTRGRAVIRRAARSLAAVALVASTLLGGAPVPTSAAVPAGYSAVRVGLTKIMSGLVDPVFVTNAGDASNRLFVVEQGGVIRIFENGRLLATPFLDIRAKVEAGGERGLLGLAFHPNFATDRRFYVFFTERATGDLIVAQYLASSTNHNRALTSSFRRLLRIDHRANANHNGGMLAFGPDGYLYIGTGDGGGAGDMPNNSQSLRTRLGKLLRIDVNGTSPGLAYRIPPSNPYATSATSRREIWSRGLRNPWRFSFDRSTGDLWIGDVGQGRYEEVDRALRSSGGGRAANFGWHVVEGNACYQPSIGCTTTGLVRPLAVYDHSQGCAIIGGYVYRGPIAILRGAYLFGDVCSGEIWSVVAAGPARQTPVLMADAGLGITSFGEGENGALYLTTQDGAVYRLTAAAR
jgi:glucose/arabinose dehydrogenase